MSAQYQVANNKRAFKFEISFPNGETAFIEYRWQKGNMVLMRTLVPTDMRGKGIGAYLVKFVLDYVRANDLKVIIYCPFITKYLEGHPEYNDLVTKQ